MLLIDDWIPRDALLCIWAVRVNVTARLDLGVMDEAGAADLRPDSLIGDEAAGTVEDVVLRYPGVVTQGCTPCDVRIRGGSLSIGGSMSDGYTDKRKDRKSV